MGGSLWVGVGDRNFKEPPRGAIVVTRILRNSSGMPGGVLTWSRKRISLGPPVGSFHTLQERAKSATKTGGGTMSARSPACTSGAFPHQMGAPVEAYNIKLTSWGIPPRLVEISMELWHPRRVFLPKLRFRSRQFPCEKPMSFVCVNPSSSAWTGLHRAFATEFTEAFFGAMAK